MQGIYKITINNKSYIGKDMKIDSNKRFNQHLKMLFSNTHYNKYMQNYFNKYKIYSYEILVIGSFSKEELSKIEIEQIELYKTNKNGFNLTIGGEGGIGVIKSQELKKSISLRTSQSNNPMSKISYEDFLIIVKMLNDGATNTEIGNHFNLNSGYVSLIRHKKRYSDWWETVTYNEISSSGKCAIKYEEFVDIIENLKILNKDMATKYNVDRSIISNIRNKKGYKEYYQRYNQVQRPTKSSDFISDEPSSVGPSGGY